MKPAREPHDRSPSNGAAETSTAPRDSSPAPHGFDRRQFLAGGLTALAAAASARTPHLRAAPGDDAAPTAAQLEPGFVGPQFFDDAERQALLDVWESGSPFRFWGPGRPLKVQQFEEQFARAMGARFALGVTSGTTALNCAVAALGVGPGDEVIVPAYTWWSDYTCVVHAGALPVFAEIDRTFNLDPTDVARKITPRTKAILAVHLLGGPCDLDPLLALARRHPIAIIEDAAQAVGGSYRGRKLGSIGALGIYSFQINKMITSGEGGAVVTNDPRLYERAVRFHDMGVFRSLFAERTGATQVEMFAGENYRMSELTGAVLRAQLPKLDAMVTSLRQHAEAVLAGIADLPGIRLRQRPDPAGDIGYAVYFETRDRATRDRCIQELRRRQVPASTLTGSVLLPVEESVIHKRVRHPQWPSFTSTEGKAMSYGAACCPQTQEILNRFVQIRLGPRYTSRIDAYLIENIRAVYREQMS